MVEITAKEKAEELVEKYYQFEFNTISLQTQRKYAKQCALIAVDELIKATVPLTSTYFWQEVKTEIERL